MADEVTPTFIPNQGETEVSPEQNTNPFSPVNQSVIMDISNSEQQINVGDDAALQAVLTAMTEPEMHAFLDELNKSGEAHLSSIGQTIKLLTVPASQEAPSTTSVLSQSQLSSEHFLQELHSLIQQAPTDIIPLDPAQKTIQQPIATKSSIHTALSGSRQARTANTYGGTPVVGGSRLGTAVKSTVTPNGGTTMRKPFQQQQQQQIINDDRMFFGRPVPSITTTIGQGQYQNRTGLVSDKQTSTLGQQRHIPTSDGIEHHQQPSQRRPLSWFQNRSRHHSSDDDADSDRDSSPPLYSQSGNDQLGPTRRSTRVPKPKQDADFVTFPLLDRDEHGNPIPPTPSSMPLHKAEDDEDDIPYRLMDYPRPSRSSTGTSPITSSSTSTGPGRKPRTVAEMRAATAIAAKKQPRWPDDELYHVKSFVPLIMPQQITNPSTMKNKMTMCKPLVCEREVEAKPTRCTIATQTEMENMIPDVPLVTLPVPIYLPSPTPSYQLFRPRAVPIPVPVFVPVMIPVPRKAFKNIREFFQTQRELLPDDPFEAALVLHAESLVRAENQTEQTRTNQGDDSIVMMDLTHDDAYFATSRTMENLPELDLEMHYIDPITSTDPEVSKLLRMLPDANYRLKWTYGVEAFQQWCTRHNQPTVYPPMVTESEEPMKTHPIKSDLLSYTSGDELQRVIAVFLREVRRPTGDQYLPESILYLCLGIQFYLHINNRAIDLFDLGYVEFNSTLNEILLSYSPRTLPGSNTSVSLIDEDLLYDAQHLGTGSPWSLLTTLIYTNTKYFNLKTVESHMAISFANFGKYAQWGRLSTSAPQGQQVNYLRFYAHNPDLKSLADAPTVYEMIEQVTDSGRCPIKQYDFYVSKCPEPIRGTADIFYLHPITGPIPENSVWFSDESLSSSTVEQILNRLKLLPDFSNQTKPVETNSSSTANQMTATSTSTS